jgi:hypothetical protein
MFARGCRKVGPQKSSIFMKRPVYGCTDPRLTPAGELQRKLRQLAKAQPMAAARIAKERGIIL